MTGNLIVSEIEDESLTAPSASADNLRRLYLARFVFAVAWAATFAALGDSLDTGSVTLLIVYPAVDVAAALVDLRASRSPVLYVNIAISALAALGLAIAATSDIPAVVRVWAAWAIAAGAVQLVVAVQRRATGGQWPMILAGGLSVLVGGGLLAGASSATSLVQVAGYAAAGGVFFLASAVRLHLTGRQRRVRSSR